MGGELREVLVVLALPHYDLAEEPWSRRQRLGPIARQHDGGAGQPFLPAEGVDGVEKEAADRWIQDTSARPGTSGDQVIVNAVGLLVRTLDKGSSWRTEPRAEAQDADAILTIQTIDGLIAAIQDSDKVAGLAAMKRILNALRHADPARSQHRRQLVLRQVITPLGRFLHDRALAVAYAFLQDRGGYLADPTVHRAADAALNTYEKTLIGMHHTGRLGEDTYLALLTARIQVEDDFTLASRYTTIPNS